jgi:ubiquinone/menaquinone biosynthesis C-methylase UbiE
MYPHLIEKNIMYVIKDQLTECNKQKNYRNSKIAHFTNRFYIKNKDNLKFLDLGVGDGKKIKSIVSYLNKEYELYGTDIEDWGPYKKERKLDFPFKFIQKKPYKIPYDNKMFDCIFIILTLHHIENIIEVLKECRRILKDDGCIVLVEHDVWSDDTRMLVDLQHRIYSTIFKENSEGFKANYYNFFEWDIIFNKAGFKSIMGDRLQDDIEFHLRYDMVNITIYSKKEYEYMLHHKKIFIFIEKEDNYLYEYHQLITNFQVNTDNPNKDTLEYFLLPQNIFHTHAIFSNNLEKKWTYHQVCTFYIQL